MADLQIYGIHAVQEALNAATPLGKVYIQRDARNPRINELARDLKAAGVPVQLVPREKMQRLTKKAHQGVIAMLSSVEYMPIEELLPRIYEKGESPLLVVLDGVTDVRNAGAIARSAECFGAHALLMPAQGSALLNEDAVKSSAGALNRIPVARELHFNKATDFLAESGLQLIACTEHGEEDICRLDLTVPTAIVLGSEGAGIHPNLLAKCTAQVRIPMAGEISSLNVGVAAGIVLYEVCRARLAAEK